MKDPKFNVNSAEYTNYDRKNSITISDSHSPPKEIQESTTVATCMLKRRRFMNEENLGTMSQVGGGKLFR